MGIVISKGPDGGENGVASLVFLVFPQKIKGYPDIIQVMMTI
jgi:hypothetical protein